jgi:hypothetical protein
MLCVKRKFLNIAILFFSVFKEVLSKNGTFFKDTSEYKILERWVLCH